MAGFDDFLAKKKAKGQVDTTTSNSPVTEDDEAAKAASEDGSLTGSTVLNSLLSGAGPAGKVLSFLAGPTIREAEGQAEGPIDAGVLAATNAATMGATGMLARHGGAAQDAVGNSGEMSYDDFLAQRTADRKELMDENSGSALVGTLLGSVLGGTGATKAGAAAVEKLGASGLNNVVTRLLAGGGLGAAENVAVSAGEGTLDGDNALGTGLLGALFGAGGQALGEAIPAASRFAADKLFRSKTSRQVLKEAARNITEGGRGPGNLAGAMNDGDALSRQFWEKAASEAGGADAKMLGEGSPDLLRATAALADKPSATGMLKDVSEKAATRMEERASKVRSLFLDNFVDSNRAVTGAAAKEASEADAAAAQLKFREIFENSDAKTVPVISKKALLDNAKRLRDNNGQLVWDEANATSSVQNTYRAIEDLIAGVGKPAKKGAKMPTGITLQGLQNIKLDLDKAISGAKTNSSIDSMSTSDLIKIKTFVNDTLKSISPEYEEAAAVLGKKFAKDDAAELGRKMMGGTNTSWPVSDIKAYLATLPADVKGSFQDGALDWLTGQLDSTPTYLKKLTSSNRGAIERVRAIFGDAIASNNTTLEDIVKAADNAIAGAADYKSLAGARTKSIANAFKAPDAEAMKHLFDLGAVVGKLGTGQLTSGTLYSGGRRLIANDLQPVQQVLMDLLSSDSPEKANTILKKLWAAQDAPNAGMTGGILGAAAGAGTNEVMR